MSEAADPILPYHQRYIEACRKGDAAAFSALYSETCVFMPPNEPSIFGKGELEEWIHEYFSAFRIVTLDGTEREVTVFGDTAVERWAYLVAIRSVNGEDRIRDDGRFLTIWKNEGGTWRIAQSIFNSIRPIGGGTSRFLIRLKAKGQKLD
jgi:ketosteroid isomerase-like protein